MLDQYISKKSLKKLKEGISKREVTKIKLKKNSNNIFSLVDLNNLLNDRLLHYPNTRMANYNNTISSSFYTDKDNEISLKKLKESLSHGNTLIIKKIQAQNKEVNRFLNNINKYLFINTSANLYFVKENQKGLNIHYDKHDILVIQTEKEKYWKIYKSKKEVNFNYSISENLKSFKNKSYEIKLKENELLYIPKGTWHSTYTKSKYSLHLAISLNPFKLKDIINIISPNLLDTNLYNLDKILKNKNSYYNINVSDIL